MYREGQKVSEGAYRESLKQSIMVVEHNDKGLLKMLLVVSDSKAPRVPFSGCGRCKLLPVQNHRAQSTRRRRL
jgi:hypothetical protein